MGRTAVVEIFAMHILETCWDKSSHLGALKRVLVEEEENYLKNSQVELLTRGFCWIVRYDGYKMNLYNKSS